MRKKKEEVMTERGENRISKERWGGKTVDQRDSCDQGVGVDEERLR